MADADLDALGCTLGNVLAEFGIRCQPERQDELRRRLAEAALRARLAPTTHADDEALVEAVGQANRRYMVDMCNNREQRYATFAEEVVPSGAALRRRLAELRARAEAAEAALAECRAKIARITTEPYHTVHRDFIKPEYFTPGHALKTKEPRT